MSINVVDKAKEDEARRYIAEAQKKNKGGFFSFMSASSDRTQESIQLYEKAANCFKMAHNWRESGNAFLEAARLSLQDKSKHDAANYYNSASISFRKDDAKQAIYCLQQAIEILTDKGRFVSIAKHHMTIAEIYQDDLVDLEQAMYHSAKAADYYRMDDSKSAAMKCDQCVAQLAARLGRFDEAAKLYDSIGTAAMDHELLKHGAKDHLFRAVICHFCIDLVNGQIALKGYEESFPLFADSRECHLLKKLSDALEQENAEAFTAAVTEYNTVTPLHKLVVSLLANLKRSLNEEEDIT